MSSKDAHLKEVEDTLQSLTTRSEKIRILYSRDTLPRKFIALLERQIFKVKIASADLLYAAYAGPTEQTGALCLDDLKDLLVYSTTHRFLNIGQCYLRMKYIVVLPSLLFNPARIKQFLAHRRALREHNSCLRCQLRQLRSFVVAWRRKNQKVLTRE